MVINKRKIKIINENLITDKKENYLKTILKLLEQTS